MQYHFNLLKGVGLGQILQHVWDTRETQLEDLYDFMQQLEAAFGVRDWVGSAQ